MTKDKTYDPFEGFRQLTEMWERQLNGLLYMMTDNKDFVRTANIGLDTYSRYMELLRRNQDFVAGMMNIPTKKDVAKVAKLSIQAEEKIDGLEDQIWALKDQVSALNNENLAFFQDVVTSVKELKAEIQKNNEGLINTKQLESEIKELRQAIVDIRIMQVNLQELHKDVEEIKEFHFKRNIENTNEVDALKKEIGELKQGISQVTDIKKELTSLKTLVKKEKEKELVLADAGTSK